MLLKAKASKSLSVLLLCCLSALGGLAQDVSHQSEAVLPASPVSFVLNKNQWVPKVRFAADIPDGRLFAEDDRLTYAFADMEDFHDRFHHGHHPKGKSPDAVDCHAFQMIFEGSTGARKVEGKFKRPEYHNYFIGNDPSQWASEVPLFREIEWEEIYPGIDFRMYGQDIGLKYDFIVSAGADPNQIGLRYEGLKRIALEKGRLSLQTTVNLINEMAPVAYQYLPNGERAEVPCAFVLNGNKVSFAFPQGYRRELPLIIDPTLIFSTYTGSVADNFGYTATYDNVGNLYAGGITFGLGYPTTSGAYQTNFAGGGVGGAWTNNGGVDITISKFASAGSVLLYATYLGGSANDQPHSLVCNDQDQLYIYGKTYSANFPVTQGAYDMTYNGASDMIVSKLSPNGATLVGSTFIGGSSDDGVNINTTFSPSSLKRNYGDDARGDIATFQNGNCVVASCTQSNNFPTSPGAFQTAIGGFQDAVSFELSNDLTALIWSTYLGGNASDAAYTVEIDNSGSVFVAGGTESPNYPVTNGVINQVNSGGIDGFITHINSSGTGLVKSTYLGTNGYDQIYFLQLDKNDNVYVLGQTAGAWPVTPGVYSNPNSGQFVTKLNPALNNIIYSTVVGNSTGAPNISPTAFLVDVCEYVYISGWGGAVNASFLGGNTNNMPITPGALQSTTDGSDLHMMVLRKDAASLEYATYMGGTLSDEHVDGGTSRFSDRAEIYQAVCAGCWNNDDFPTSNAYSATNNSTGCNLAAFKIDFPLPGILADFTANPNTGGCAPHTVVFTNTSIGGTNYYWEFGDGGTSLATNPTHTYTSPGTYTVMLVAIDLASCNQFDTTYGLINVYPAPAAQAIPDTTICNGSGINLNGSGGATYQWSPPTGLSSTTVANPIATPTATTTYTMIASNPGGCNDTTQVTVTVIPTPTAVAGPDTTLCAGSNVQLTGSGGISYQWSPATGLNNPNIANPIASPLVSTNYVLTVTAANGCTDTDVAAINISQVNASAGNDQQVCLGSSVQLNGSGGGTYQWSPATGLSNPNIANPTASPATTTTYTLTVTNSFGCVGTDQVTVQVNPIPVVNAGPDVTICYLESTMLTATGANFYSWTPSADLSSPFTASTLATPPITTQFFVTGSNQFGCIDTDDVLVTVLPLPNVDAGNPVTMCKDSVVNMLATGAASYVWSPASGLSNPNIANPTASPASTTLYTVTGTGSNGCTATDTVRITVTQTPAVDATDAVEICLHYPIRLLAYGGDSIVWSTGETGISITVSPPTSTYYTVITYVDGCPSLPDTAWVTVYDTFPEAIFTVDPDSGLMPLTVNFDNQSVGNTYNNWYLGNGIYRSDEEFIYTYNEFGEFEVMLVVTNEWGCKDTAYKHIIATGDFGIFVPNAFTPNNDGHNDFFETPHFGIKEYHIMIFDRWGMMIYESFDKDFNWFGTFKDNDCQEGVYTYVIDAKGYLGQTFKKAGTVTLIR